MRSSGAGTGFCSPEEFPKEAGQLLRPLDGVGQALGVVGERRCPGLVAVEGSRKAPVVASSVGGEAEGHAGTAERPGSDRGAAAVDRRLLRDQGQAEP